MGGLVAVVFVLAFRRRLPVVVIGPVVVVWVLAISWAYVTIATKSLTDPALMSVSCPDETPGWWPSWVPLP